MTQQQAIQRLCDLAQAAATVLQEGGTRVSLTIHGRYPRGRTAYIAGRGSPRGEVVGWYHEGAVVVVDATDLAAWCCAQLVLRGVEVGARVSEEVE